jgi:hypothetical protein
MRWDLFVAFFFPSLDTAVGLSFLTVEVSRSHLDTPQSVRSFLRPTQRPLNNFTQHSQQTDIHAPGGIRTGNPSKQAVAGPCLRLRGRRDRLFVASI